MTLDSHGDDHAVVFGVNVGVLDGPDAFERFADRFFGTAPRALGRGHLRPLHFAADAAAPFATRGDPIRGGGSRARRRRAPTAAADGGRRRRRGRSRKQHRTTTTMMTVAVATRRGQEEEVPCRDDRGFAASVTSPAETSTTY